MERAEQARQMLTTQRQELLELVSRASKDGTEAAFERLKRWKLRTAKLLKQHVHTEEGERFAAKRKVSFRLGDPHGDLVDEARMYNGFLQALEDELAEHPESVLWPALPAESEPVAVTSPSHTPSESVVFLVHGHDELNLLRLKDLVRDRWKLEPLVLSGEAGRGRTIIEKFEEEAQRASFAFVLMSPDDQVAISDGGYAQARPNVIFELGWFYGRLGRDRVCILYKKGTKIHTDLDGVSRVEFGSSVNEKIDEIERELVTAKMLKGGAGGGA